MADASSGASGSVPKRRFVKLYGTGLDRLDTLFQLKGGPTVGRLWTFLVKHAGHDNALVVTVELIAEALGVHERSIRRAARVLEDAKAIVIAKLGNANVYILNDSEVWKTYEDHHRFCGFRARALIGFKENPGLRARLTHFLPEPQLFDAEGSAGDDGAR